MADPVPTSMPTGRQGRLLLEEPFRQMCASLEIWRLDPHIREMEARRSKGRIVPFVRGLRFSALLTYATRELLAATRLEADWGHIIDDQENLCSRECDIIIHRKGHYARWDGRERPIMDFKFIQQKDVVAVISCKSFLQSVDADYCRDMAPYAGQVWLFAECCCTGYVPRLQRTAKKAGYKHFWYLYTWDHGTTTEPNDRGWNQFVREARKLVSR